MADHGATVNEWVNVVRRARLPRTTKLVALTLASYANPDGTRIYPSIARLVVQCRIRYSTCRRAIADLRSAGLLELVTRGGRGRSNEYRLILSVDLLERWDVPSPDEERSEIDAIVAANRAASAGRTKLAKHKQRLRSPEIAQNDLSALTRDPVSALTRDPPPSMETSPGNNPPFSQVDLRTDVDVVGHPQADELDQSVTGEDERERQSRALVEWMRQQEQAQR
jgi:hypothetical protein